MRRSNKAKKTSEIEVVAASVKGSSSTQSFIKSDSCFISTEMVDKQPINLSYEPIPLEMTESKEQNIGSSSYYDLVPLIIDEGEITHEEEIGKPSPDVSFSADKDVIQSHMTGSRRRKNFKEVHCDFLPWDSTVEREMTCVGADKQLNKSEVSSALKDDACSNEPKRERDEDLDIKRIDHGSTCDLDLTFDQENQIKIEIEYHDL